MTGDPTTVPDPPFVLLTGPEAAAALGRMTGVHAVAAGEGWMRWAGKDGDVWSVYADEGTTLDLLDDAEVTASMWRSARTVRRFATRADLDAWLAAEAARFTTFAGMPPVRVGPDDGAEITRRERWEVRLGLSSGVEGAVTHVLVIDHGEGDAGVAIVDVDPGMRDGRPLTVKRPVAAGEIARLRAELDLLGVNAWDEWEPVTLDGLNWSLQVTGPGGRVVSGGMNAYPPDGSGPDSTGHFDRLLLAVERVTGVSCGFGSSADGIAAITDPAAAIEHGLLGALREWAQTVHDRDLDAGALTEPDVRRELVEHLAAGFGPVRSDIALKGTKARLPTLPRWPDVGRLDLALSLDRAGLPAWVELTWAKGPGELSSSARDAAKLAEALRAGQTRHAYLVAGAPLGVWGTERARRLFASSVHDGATIVSDYADSWRAWMREGGLRGPADLPTPVMSTPVGTVVLPTGGEWWQIEIARIDAPGGDRFAIAPVLGRPRTREDRR